MNPKDLEVLVRGTKEWKYARKIQPEKKEPITLQDVVIQIKGKNGFWKGILLSDTTFEVNGRTFKLEEVENDRM